MLERIDYTAGPALSDRRGHRVGKNLLVLRGSALDRRLHGPRLRDLAPRRCGRGGSSALALAKPGYLNPLRPPSERIRARCRSE